MTDRDLRDEIEQLATELREARKQLDFGKSVTAGAERLRNLTAKLASARLQAAALKQQIPATGALLAAREEERSMLQDELASARKRIAVLDPPANPLEQTPPNWNPTAETMGCLQVLVLGFMALALGWWLR